MRTLPLLALTGCLSTNYELSDEEINKCHPQIQKLEQSCDAWDGTFNKEVVDARKCFSERVVIVCSKIGLSGNSLYIGNYPQ